MLDICLLFYEYLYVHLKIRLIMREVCGGGGGGASAEHFKKIRLIMSNDAVGTVPMKLRLVTIYMP
jgi:hypothetical protein